MGARSRLGVLSIGLVWCFLAATAVAESGDRGEPGDVDLLGTQQADLDPTFGSGGIVRFEQPAWKKRACPTRPLLDGEGRIYIVDCVDDENRSGDTDIHVVRFGANGALDSTFGAGGEVLIDLSDTWNLVGAAVFDPAGRILIAGTEFVANQGYQLTVTRLLPNGTLDATFGLGGVGRFTAFPGGPTTRDGLVFIDVDSKGRIVVAGAARECGICETIFLAARLTGDGEIDSSYGVDGRVGVYGSYDWAGGAALDQSDRLVATYQASDGSTAVIRLTEEGELDPGFGDNGGRFLRLDPKAFNERVRSLAISPSGRIYLAGEVAANRVAIARLRSDGSFDSSFGDGGRSFWSALTHDTVWVEDLQIYDDGRIALAGIYTNPDNEGGNNWEQLALRFSSDGSPDRTFSGEGVALTDTRSGAGWAFEYTAKLTIDPSGRMIIASHTSQDDHTPDYRQHLAIVRYRAQSDGPIHFPPASPTFIDIEGSVFAGDIEWLVQVGITRGCNPPINDRFCPDDPVTRGQMAAFLKRALNLAPAGDPFVDTSGSVFTADIGALVGAGITRGCNPPMNDRFCPDDPVTRGQMAAFLKRALGLPVGSGGRFVDTAVSVFEADIDALAAAGVTRGCNPPMNDRFCPDDPVTRGQMAAFLRRALGP